MATATAVRTKKKSKKSKKMKNPKFRIPENWDASIKKVSKSQDFSHVDFERGSYVDGSLTTGCLAMNLVTGGGLPRRRIVEIHGPSGSGKSTTAFHIALEALLLGIPVMFFDHECAVDSKYLEGIGYNLKSKYFKRLFHYYQPDTGEQTFRFVSRHLKNIRQIDDALPSVVIIVDSAAAMLPELLDEKDDNKQRGVLASMLSNGFRLVKGPIAKSGALFVFVNQVRTNPNAMFGNPEYTPGGRAVEFYPDIRIRVGQITPKGSKHRMKEEKEDGKLGHFMHSKIFTKKNKLFPPFREGFLRIEFGKGFDPYYDLTQYLYMTGQARKKAGKLKFELVEPSKSVRGLDGKTMAKKDVRKLAKDKDGAIYQFVHAQMKDSTAFDIYNEMEAQV